jgi:protein TonB
MVIHRVDPVYPQLARNMRIAGVVKVHVMIGANGRVIAAKATAGNAILADAAEKAIRQWIYRPATTDGKPIQSETDVDVSFVLK